ncbi:hypothetical protein BT96DRAFT_1004248 [Gymnopus androsaceus JB14]|uniref:Uncharacterized protein n=1 Tax=Gymnopus androsaceus JB14 TaxID=1447944 RepID=A0A6A4GRK1_9AGAR|nr:hypothetical protein BT96DRAFT_1004248 [Gymnopus androsaceus JB14]
MPSVDTGLTSVRDNPRVVRRDFDRLHLDFDTDNDPGRSTALDGVPTREWSQLQLEHFFGTEGSEPPTLTISQVLD